MTKDTPTIIALTAAITLLIFGIILSCIDEYMEVGQYIRLSGVSMLFVSALVCSRKTERY